MKTYVFRDQTWAICCVALITVAAGCGGGSPPIPVAQPGMNVEDAANAVVAPPPGEKKKT